MLLLIIQKKYMKNPIYPFLWFDGQAKEAAEYYCLILSILIF